MPGWGSIAASRSACARRSATSTPTRTPRRTSTRASASATSTLQRTGRDRRQVKSAASTSTIVLNNNGQTSGQITAQAAFANAVSAAQHPVRRPLSVLRTSHRHAARGTGQRHARRHGDAGRAEADDRRAEAGRSGPDGLGRLAVTAPPLTTTVTSVAEDGSLPFGLKLIAVTSSLTGATITQPSGVPPAVTVDLGAVNPNDGEKVKFTFQTARRHDRSDRTDRVDDDAAAVRSLPDRLRLRSRRRPTCNRR